jgi:allantoinase
MTNYPRDLIGYAANPPDPRWPGSARLAKFNLGPR